MTREVFVTGVEVIAPGFTRSGSASGTNEPSRSIEPHRTLRLGRLDCRFTRPELDPTDPHIPSGREAKILRRDVALALVCVGRLLERLAPDEVQLAESGLFVATGLCQDDGLEEQIERMCASYVTEYGDRPEADRNLGFFRMLPPLMALAGLSNASACFIARECRVLGPNAVFGVTSHAGHAALREGFRCVAHGAAELTVVGGANAAGTLSALTLSPLAKPGDVLREAEAAGFVVLESRDSARAAGREPMARLVEVDAQRAVPDPRSPAPVTLSGLADHPALAGTELLFHGGSCFERDARAVADALAGAEVEAEGWYDVAGCLGAASVPIGLAASAARVSGGGRTSATYLNRDVYGRESWLRVEAA